MEARACELCDREAAVYCSADSAFLCFTCDSKVHAANFLVARHVRRAVCSNCKSLTGVKSPPQLPICRSCSHESTSSSLSSASCSDHTKSNRSSSPSPVLKVNSTTTTARRLESKTEAVLVNWCRKIGLESNFVCDVVMLVAMEAIGVCSSQLTISPFRVALAASLWFSLRRSGDGSASTLQVLKKIERISGVSAKLILVAESKIARLVSRRRKASDEPLEEGWAES